MRQSAFARLICAAGASLVFGLGALGCGDDDDPSQPAPSGGEGAGGASASGGAGGAGPSGAAGAGAGGQGGAQTISAPSLERVEKMAGNLHVFWSLPEGVTCENVEGERKTDAEPYKVVFRVPGTVRDHHDGTAEDDTVYTYRLRCSVGADYSAYSGEMSGNPKAP